MSPPGFEASYERFAELVGFMAGDESARLDHGEVEHRLSTESRELMRQLFQDHLDLRAATETPIDAVVEGACRHLVKDRLDITGARWGLNGAEAILKLRAIRTNGDFDNYWNHHINQERHRVHESRYANGVIPKAA